MIRHLHLKPSPAMDRDPVFAAAVAHASTIADISDPIAAMRAAFQAAGVDALEERYDVLLGELDRVKARHAAAVDALGWTNPDDAVDSPAPGPIDAAARVTPLRSDSVRC